MISLVPTSPAAVDILGVPITPLPLPTLVDLAFRRIASGRKTLFTTANAHAVMVAQRLPALAGHFQEADAVLADGVSVTVGARISGLPSATRTCGPDFFEAFLAQAARSRVSVFFLGTNDETLAMLSARCRSRWPSLAISGTLAPPYGTLSREQSSAIARAVNAVRPDALFVAMTAPKQELWISEHLDDLDVRFAMGVGAAFDFSAGKKPRAPEMVRRAGLEWAFRLALEPRRMWRRNVDSLTFVASIATSLVEQKVQRVLATSDARVSDRLPVRLAATVNGHKARTVNVGNGGLCADVRGHVAPGDRVAGVVHAHDGDIAFSGAVSWTEPGSGGCVRTGILLAGWRAAGAP